MIHHQQEGGGDVTWDDISVCACVSNRKLMS